MVLTREQKERLVLDLYNQGKSTGEIAEEARMSFRDIGAILNKAMEDKETSKEQSDKISKSTQSYKLFSEGKTPIQVAIALNIQEPEVAKFYVEYWKLKGSYMLNQIYEEIKDDIGYFVSLYRSAKSAGIGIPHVVKLLTVANNHLPAVEYKYEELQKQIDVLEYDKRSATRDFQNLTDQNIAMGKQLDSIRLDCEKERAQLDVLEQKRIKQEALVKHFENSNEVYIKIRKTVEEKVISILSDRKMLLKLALLSLTESMRKDPEKYNAFIFCDNKSSYSTTQTRGYSQYYDTVPYGQQQRQQYSSHDYISMLLEESEKLYNKLAKELVDEILTEVAAKNIIYDIEGKFDKKIKFEYKTKGMMAEIGKRTGVATLFGFNLTLADSKVVTIICIICNNMSLHLYN